MMSLIIGGSGSGKSAYAEQLIMALADVEHTYYIATMQVFDEESRQKIERHRSMRAGKGFLTVEQPIGISNARTHMEPGKSAVLLECMSNLVANEMFSGNVPEMPEQVAAKVVREIRELSTELTHLVIVTNNIFEDGITYDAATEGYLRALGLVNRCLAQTADQVVEIIVGIPVILKEESREMSCLF